MTGRVASCALHVNCATLERREAVRDDPAPTAAELLELVGALAIELDVTRDRLEVAQKLLARREAELDAVRPHVPATLWTAALREAAQ